MLEQALLLISILIVSVVLHELAHGLVAYSLGDPTAKLAGRLTLNPVKHLDPVGSFIVPGMLIFTAGFAFGWAKPVPVTPSKLRGTDRSGFAVVALAGPVANVVIAFACALVLRSLLATGAAPGEMLPRLLSLAILVNVFLAAFNLIPIPPLDGSRMLRMFLGAQGRARLDQIEPFGFLILLVLLVWLNEPFLRIVDIIRSLILRILPL